MPDCASLLEVGCGFGHFLEACHERRIQALGVEVSDAAIIECRRKGLDVTSLEAGAPPLSSALRSQSFDVVASYSVLEHLHNPLQFLCDCVKMLRPRGVLILRVPETPSTGPELSLVQNIPYMHAHTYMRARTHACMRACC